MSRIEEIEKAVESLPVEEFVKLAAWLSQRSLKLDSNNIIDKSEVNTRDHTAFLNSYSPEDEGLYDDVAAG